MKIEFRKANKEDAERLIDIYNAESYADYIRYGECPGHGKSREMMERSIIEYPKFLIKYDNKAVGCISCREAEKRVYEDGCLCVIPEYQEKGIGTSALTFIKIIIRTEKKFTLITPEGKIENIRSYTEKCGFALESVEKDGNVTVARLVLER